VQGLGDNAAGVQCGSVATTPLVMGLQLRQDVNDKGACVLGGAAVARWTSSVTTSFTA
jgi:hypothetical protein